MTKITTKQKSTATFIRYRTDGRLVADIERLWHRVELASRAAGRATKRGDEEEAAAWRADAHDLEKLAQTLRRGDWEGAFDRLEEMDTAVGDCVPARLTAMIWRRVLGHDGMR